MMLPPKASVAFSDTHPFALGCCLCAVPFPRRTGSSSGPDESPLATPATPATPAVVAVAVAVAVVAVLVPVVAILVVMLVAPAPVAPAPAPPAAVAAAVRRSHVAHHHPPLSNTFAMQS